MGYLWWDFVPSVESSTTTSSHFEKGLKMSLYDYVSADERFRCEKCGKITDVQTKGALGQFRTLTINELAAFMALYGNGEGLLLYGYYPVCHHMTYFELKPVTIERIDNPYEDEYREYISKIGAKGGVIAMDEAKDKEDHGSKSIN